MLHHFSQSESVWSRGGERRREEAPPGDCVGSCQPGNVTGQGICQEAGGTLPPPLWRTAAGDTQQLSSPSWHLDSEGGSAKSVVICHLDFHQSSRWMLAIVSEWSSNQMAHKPTSHISVCPLYSLLLYEMQLTKLVLSGLGLVQN